MNKPIIIQGALQSEIDYLLEKLEIKNKEVLGGYDFYECLYKDYPIVICKTKMGEICSAIATTLCIQKYDPLCIINQGTAGALVEWLNKNDVVIGEKIYYISQFSTEENKEFDNINPWKKDKYITLDNEAISYNSDEKLIQWLKQKDILMQPNIYFDIVGSGDVWSKELSKMKKYNNDYGVVCEAMECSGAYLAANSFNIPLVTIRVISNNEFKHQEYDPKTSIYAQKISISIVDEFLNEM